MQIAFVIDTLYPFELGGAQKRVWEIGRRLADNHDVHVFGMKYWGGEKTLEQDGMTYHGVCAERDLYKNDRRSLTQPLIYAASLAGPLGAEDFDVIDCQKSAYFHFLPTKLTSLLGDAALVGTFTEVWGDYWYDYIGRLGALGKFVERTSISLPEQIITISHKNKRDLINLGRDQSDITIIPDGIGFEEIDTIPPSNQSFDVLYAGRLVEHKNVDLLLSAIERLNDSSNNSVTCGIIGKGPDMAALKRQVSEAEIEDDVEFLGFLEEIDDVYSFMKSAEVFVLPSSREGAGLVTLEANACGTPSITTRHENNAATEVVDDDINGYVCDMSVAGLAEVIRTAINRGPEMETDCIEYAKEYEWDKIATDTLKVYEKACQ